MKFSEFVVGYLENLISTDNVYCWIDTLTSIYQYICTDNHDISMQLQCTPSQIKKCLLKVTQDTNLLFNTRMQACEILDDPVVTFAVLKSVTFMSPANIAKYNVGYEMYLVHFFRVRIDYNTNEMRDMFCHFITANNIATGRKAFESLSALATEITIYLNTSKQAGRLVPLPTSSFMKPCLDAFFYHNKPQALLHLQQVLNIYKKYGLLNDEIYETAHEYASGNSTLLNKIAKYNPSTHKSIFNKWFKCCH